MSHSYASNQLQFYQDRRLEAAAHLAQESRPHWQRAYEATIEACDLEIASIRNGFAPDVVNVTFSRPAVAGSAVIGSGPEKKSNAR